MNVYYEKDSRPETLKAKKIAIIGYGSQGHAHALNLANSGLDVRVGVRKEGASWRKALAAGLPVFTVNEACRHADIIMILVPDEIQPLLYREEILDTLTPGMALGFAHGFNIHYSQILPPDGVDVFMVAPKGPGHLVRFEYTQGRGVPALIAVYRDATGTAKDLALAYACALGSGRAGILETTFREETETDLFGEQAVLCGGVTELILAGFETLVEAGYAPEIAYFECLHELKLIVDLIYEGGLTTMYYSVSNTAQYGGLSRGKAVLGEETRKAMRRLLEDIQSGRFAREWVLENQAHLPVFRALTRAMESHPIEMIGRELRKMMPWLAVQRKVDKDKA